MAGPKPPTWKQVFDVAERTIGTRINEFAKSENAAILMGLATRASRELSTRTERLSRQVLHLANLPAGSDVNRLLAQIGKLEREVRELRNQLDDATDTLPAIRLAPRPAARASQRRTTRPTARPTAQPSPRASAATSSGSRASAASKAASTTKTAGNGRRKVATNGVVRQPSRRARQDPA